MAAVHTWLHLSFEGPMSSSKATTIAQQLYTGECQAGKRRLVIQKGSVESAYALLVEIPEHLAMGIAEQVYG